MWIYSHHCEYVDDTALAISQCQIGLKIESGIELKLCCGGILLLWTQKEGGMVIFIGGASEYGSHSKLFIEHCGTLHSTPLSISLALQAPLVSV